MDGVIGFVLGLFFGGSAGIFAMALAIAAKTGDEALDGCYGGGALGENDKRRDG